MHANKLLPNFDNLIALYQADPQSFEQTRRRILLQAIDEAPAEHRSSLEALLEKIESVRHEIDNPVEAAAEAFHLMCNSVSTLCGAWDQASMAAAEWQAAFVIERARGTWH